MDILELLGKIGFDTRIFIFNLINFIVIALLFRKFFYSKISKIILDRQVIINKGIENSIKAEKDLISAGQQRDSILNEAQKKGRKVFEEYKLKAEQNAQEIVDASNKEKIQIIESAKVIAEKETLKKMNEFKLSAGKLVILATEKLLNREVTSDSYKVEDEVAESMERLNVNKIQ